MGTAVEFSGTVRRWNPDKPGGLAVVDVPPDCVAKLGPEEQLGPAASCR
jgi:hypothetical protein